MLISHRYKFIYTKTVKTAGTSTESYFERFCLPDGEWEELHNREAYESEYGVIGHRGKIDGRNVKWYNHMPAEEIKNLVGDDIWNSYYKFCSIRNPWDKVISAYFHFGKNYKFKTGRKILQRLRHPTFSPQQHRFLSWLKKGRYPIDRDKYLIDGKTCIDKFIRFESMEADMMEICRTLGLPWNDAWLPHFKGEKRNRSVTPQDLYTKPAHEVIEQQYEYEIQAFNYSYPQ